jgi:hypothetical protein
MLSVPADFGKAAERRNAQINRYCQAAAMIKLFWMEHLRHPCSTAELAGWVSSAFYARGKRIDPASILTQEEFHDAKKLARRARSLHKSTAKAIKWQK